MKVEHVAWVVEDPVSAAKWYETNLQMRIVRSGGPPTNVRFLADATGRVLLEIYNNPKVSVPEYRNMHPLVLHLAFLVDDVKTVRDRLIAAGATEFESMRVSEAGDELCMLRDPWGFPIQILKRATPM
ncbi:MAG: VOC family protein [Kiritimatiellae bacterium]|nr:VOC family protein [Kiritimatiellia bacterium]